MAAAATTAYLSTLTAALLLSLELQRAAAGSQSSLVHQRAPREALGARFGAECGALSSGVAGAALVGAECYFGTADAALSWDGAWAECGRLWDGARLASVRGPISALAQRLAAAGFDGDYRLALVRPYGNESYWAEDGGTQPPQPQAAYATLPELCTPAVTSKPSVYADGSCYVYMDGGAYPPSSWAAAVDKCRGHVPGYEGHAAWPTSAGARDAIPTLVGGKHSDRMYWLGAKTKMPRTADAENWHLMRNSTTEVGSGIGELPADAILWKSGQPNENFGEASAVYVKYGGSMDSAAVYDWHHDDDLDGRRQDAICEYREPKARPADYEYALHTESKKITDIYATRRVVLGDIDQCAALCHAHGVDRCRCFMWNTADNVCKVTYAPCAHPAHPAAAAKHALYTLSYADLRATTGVLGINGGLVGRATPSAPHRALCVKDAPKFATYGKQEVDGAASAASVIVEFAGGEYAQGEYGGPQCAWQCMSTPGCGSFDHSADEQKCTLYAGAADSAYAKSALDHV